MQELQADGMPGTPRRTKAKKDPATPKIKRIKQPPPEPTLRMLDSLYPVHNRRDLDCLRLAAAVSATKPGKSVLHSGRASAPVSMLLGNAGWVIRGPPCLRPQRADHLPVSNEIYT